MAEDGATSSDQPQKDKELREAAVENAAAAASPSQEAQRGFQAGWLQLGVGSSAPALTERSPGAPAAASTSYGAAGERFGRRNETSGSDLRVVAEPQRQRSGVWVALRPAENQVNEPFLPQLPKSFLRIKNERMTVRLLMRYLANKLGLHDESEVEITCRRQQLQPYATLEDVRDQIWCASASEAPGPASPAVDHVMKLYYSRRA
ncbi:hypothetical protein KSP39_PZI023231 [Platanthera zijinensis]|uniref:Uncharacterized protein n=1 Tax=Platanthera zijinensis TaxID=2320716 RepID=A0AAP0AUH5_9ASPA